MSGLATQKHQSKSQVPGTDAWFFNQLQAKHGVAADCNALIVGDTYGYETDDFLVSFPGSTVSILEIDVATRAALDTKFQGDGRVTVLDHATFDLTGSNDGTFDFIACVFVLCHSPGSAEPLPLAEFNASVQELWALTKVGGFLWVVGASYYIQDVLPGACRVSRVICHRSHVDAFHVDDEKTKHTDVRRGMYLLCKVDEEAALANDEISGTGGFCVPVAVQVGTVIQARCFWSNFPTGRMRLLLKDDNEAFYANFVVRGDNLSPYTIVVNHKTAADVWTQLSIDTYDPQNHPFDGTEFTLRMTKVTADTTEWAILDADKQVFYSTTTTDHDPGSLGDVSWYCSDPKAKAVIMYNLSLQTP